MLFKYFLLWLIIPYPIFLVVEYKNKKITINKIKTININSSKLVNKKKNNKQKNKQKNKKSMINKKNLGKSFLNSYYYVSTMRFKPFLWLKCSLAYGTGDASSTGLLYGAISTIFSVLKFSVLNNLFLNKFKFHLYPYWDKKILKSKIKILLITNPLLLFFYIFLIITNYIKIIILQRRKSND